MIHSIVIAGLDPAIHANARGYTKSRGREPLIHSTVIAGLDPAIHANARC